MAADNTFQIEIATPERLQSPFWMAGLLVLTVILSYLMISTIKYRSFKDLDLRRRRPAWILPAIALFFMAVAYRPILALLVLAAVFASSGPIAKIYGFIRRRKKA